MKLKKSLLLILFIVLISSCEETTFYYKIPIANKILTIYTPAFSDYAYVYIGMHKLNAIDSFDLKIYKGETTEVSLILNKQKWDGENIMMDLMKDFIIIAILNMNLLIYQN